MTKAGQGPGRGGARVGGFCTSQRGTHPCTLRQPPLLPRWLAIDVTGAKEQPEAGCQTRLKPAQTKAKQFCEPIDCPTDIDGLAGWPVTHARCRKAQYCTVKYYWLAGEPYSLSRWSFACLLARQISQAHAPLGTLTMQYLALHIPPSAKQVRN